MKKLSQSPWKQRFLFYLGGLVPAWLCIFLLIHWMDVVCWVIEEPNLGFDRQPAGFKALRLLFTWLPWLACAAVLVLRFIKGRCIRVGSFFLGAATPLVALMAWLALGDTLDNLLHRRKFDAELWRSQERVDHDRMWPPRLCMVDHLISSGGLDGLKSNQVVQLLGPPQEKGFPWGATACDIHYYLGPERGFIRIDSEWLFITFGEDGEVSRYWLYSD